LKHGSYAIFPLLVMILVCAVFPSVGLAMQPRTVSYGPTDQPLQVWFDGTPMLTILYPTFYQFNVAAKTSSGLWITDIHWDFGDGSTIDVPFSTQSWVNDVRYHQYSQPGTYTVTVTAYDNMGNSGSAQVTVNWMTNDSVQILTTSILVGPSFGAISPNCAGGCQVTVGSPVTISISGNISSGWLFASWIIQGAYCSGSRINPCSFIMPNNPVIVYANFTYSCESCLASGGGQGLASLPTQNYPSTGAALATPSATSGESPSMRATETS